MTAQSSGKLSAAALSGEAESHVRDISATRGVVSEWMRWLHVPSLTGLECIRALRGAGFRVQAKLPGCVQIANDTVAVQVPLTEALSPDVLIAILLKAGIGPRRFLDLLDEARLDEG